MSDKRKEDFKGTITINDFKLIIDGKEIEAEEIEITENNTWKGDVPKLEIIVKIKLKNK